jgi:hypothetical protein
MKKDEYEKVFHHITELSQKHALGKIPHQTMYDGLKKLLEEVIEASSEQSIKAQKRAAFGQGFAAGIVLLGAVALLVYVLWEKGLFQGWIKATGL